jgi:raffinose/stachyose/melibiose transport system permease protein
LPRRQTIKEKGVYFTFTVPTLLLYGLFFILPLGMGVYYSMTDWNGISQSFNFIGLHNYLRMFSDHRVLNSLQFSLKYAVLLVLFVNALAIFLGLLLDAPIKSKNLFRALYFFPAIISLVVVGLVFDQILYHAIPRIGKMLDIDFLKRNLLGNRDAVFWVVLFVSIWRETAVPTVLILAGLQTVPPELIEAAVLDGAPYLTRLRKIVFPFLIPVFSMNLVLTVKSGIMVFDIIKAMTGGGPGISTESIGILIYKKGFEEMQFGFASSLSFLLFAIIAVISLLQIGVLKRKEVGQL